MSILCSSGMTRYATAVSVVGIVSTLFFATLDGFSKGRDYREVNMARRELETNYNT